MRSQLIAVLGSSFVLLTCVGSAPAPLYDSDDCVGITTIYVTIPPPIAAFDSNIEATSTVYSSAITPISKALPPASLEPSAVVTTATDITKTVEETIFITYTLGQSTETGTTTEAFDFSSSLVTSSKGSYGLLSENDQTSNLKTFDILGPSVFTLPGTTISYMVDSYPPAITSVTKAPVTSSSESPDLSTDDVVTVYETIPVIPLPVGYTGPIPTRVETSSAIEITINSDTISTGQISTTSDALDTSISAIVSSAASMGAVGSTALPKSGSHSYLGANSWNSTSCLDYKTESVSDTLSSHVIVLPSFSVSDSPASTSVTSSLVNSSNSAIFNYGIATGSKPSITGTTEFGGFASSSSTPSFTFVYPAFPTGTRIANTYLTISLSLSSSISTLSSNFTTSGSIIDDSGLITSAAPSTSSSGGAFKSTTDDNGLARTSSVIHTALASSTLTVPSVSVSGSTIDDSGLATSSTVIATTVASSTYTIPSSSASGSTIDDSSLVTSSLEGTSTPKIPASIFVASSSTSLSVVSHSSASTFMTSTIDSSSSDRSAPSKTKVTSTVPSSASPINCGELGDFSLDFDDLPPLAAPSDTADPMPIFSPYHQFYFDAGFVVVPPPTDPYLPASGKLLLEYIPIEGHENFGEVSNDYTELTGCFNFNARGASLGCDSRGPDCDWSVTGLRYNFTTKVEDQVAAQILSTTACPALKDCALIPVTFDDTFKNLTSLLIKGTVAGIEEIWWMDSVDLSWFDNSCTKGRCRAGFHGIGPQ